MENPLAKFVPQLFGEYPKPFLKLINNVSFSPDQDSKKVTEVLWKAYESVSYTHLTLPTKA